MQLMFEVCLRVTLQGKATKSDVDSRWILYSNIFPALITP